MINLTRRQQAFIHLMRLNRPIGSLLLLWPTLWALWFASAGIPSIKNLVIFTLGVFVMRSAGCVINDYADRNFDGYVERTENRPIPRGDVSPQEALILFAILCLLALGLVLATNLLTISLSSIAVGLAIIYPFSKRYTHYPQIILGAAFSWAIPMAFAAETEMLPKACWALFVTAVIWTVVYDTFYAMVDREDDLKIGIKSTAILFGDMDLIMIGLLQILTLAGLVITGNSFDMGFYYYLGLAVVALLFLRQQKITQRREKSACFKAFLDNNRVGAVVFLGIFAHYQLPPPF